MTALAVKPLLRVLPAAVPEGDPRLGPIIGGTVLVLVAVALLGIAYTWLVGRVW